MVINTSKLEDKIEGAIDFTRNDWVGLPWDINPGNCKESDWIKVLPGTYYLEKIEGGWVYICRGNAKIKVDESDVRVYWPNQ
jgi:hypothetical protein